MIIDIMFWLFILTVTVLMGLFPGWRYKLRKELSQRILEDQRTIDLFYLAKYSDFIEFHEDEIRLIKNSQKVKLLQEYLGLSSMKFKLVARQLIVYYYLEKSKSVI